jgi:hypothetical protein
MAKAREDATSRFMNEFLLGSDLGLDLGGMDLGWDME